MLLPKIRLSSKFILIALVFLTSPWFLQQPFLNKTVILIVTVSLFFYLNFKTPIFKIIFFVFYFGLISIQVISTNVKNTYNFNDHQKYLHQNRLDQYPPSLTRLGNIIENRIDNPIIYRHRQNLFDSLDFVNYFKNLFLPVLFIPFIIGLYKFLKYPSMLLATTTVTSLTILSITGSHGLYGPIIIFPTMAIFISHYFCEK